MFLLAALSLGFLGSFHCIGMCGPIALTIPVNRTSTFSTLTGSLTYNFGRIFTYGILGLLFGLIGKSFVMAGLQNTLSISVGVVILLILFIPKVSKYSSRIFGNMMWIEKIKSTIRQLFGIHSYSSLLFIGMLNGLLPCGLVYLGIAGSIATGDALKGAFFMMSFGLGTLPAMMSIPIIKDYISIRFRERIRKFIPVTVVLMAVLLILRGLNLGIPYVSPSIKKSSEGTSIHHCGKE